MWTVLTSQNNSRKFLTMKTFPVICGRPTRRLWSQQAVIMFSDGQSGGPRIIFPMKSICQAARAHPDLEDTSDATMEENLQLIEL